MTALICHKDVNPAPNAVILHPEGWTAEMANGEYKAAIQNPYATPCVMVSTYTIGDAQDVTVAVIFEDYDSQYDGDNWVEVARSTYIECCGAFKGALQFTNYYQSDKAFKGQAYETDTAPSVLATLKRVRNY